MASAFPGTGPGPGGANPKAVWSLVLGVVSVVTCLGLVAGVPAIVLGRTARREIAAAGGAQGGQGLATAGVVLGWLSIPISLTVLAILFAAGAFGS